MFNDEEPIAFKKMYQFSEVDGFLQIAEESADMIKFVANEPSVGLHYVQQHTQNAVPNLINLKKKVFEKSHETTLHSEDLEDSITMVRSMKEFGFPIADEMSREIKKSLAIMAKKQPKKGLLNSSGLRIGRTSSWSPATWGRNAVHSNPGEERTTGYLSSVFQSAKQRAENFKWARVELKESSLPEGEKLLSIVNPTRSLVKAVDGSSSSMPEAEAKYLPLSSEVDELQEESRLYKSSSHQEFLSLSETYHEFKADQEAKLKEWLGDKGNEDLHRLEKKELHN
ncbi:uncharacterized protein LOC111407396 isoform X2 [Olea europaea var. sylvestris]|nr:uncharacterized protein LOC111407396 isoform X2 [Olea europaea var. sylvestris]CAA2984313.1 BLOC-1-related complex subunit 8 homolog isoform X1 [Olea europaea subsp. europaea]